MQHPTETIGTRVLNAAEPYSDASVVHESRELPEFLINDGKHTRHFTLISNVPLDRQGLPARSLDRTDDLIRLLLLLEVVDADRVPRLST